MLDFKHSVIVIMSLCLFGRYGAWAESTSKQAPIALSQAQLEAVDDLIGSFVARENVSHASFGIWQNGEALYSGYHGQANHSSSIPTSENTIHRIYSMTKPVTAVGLLILLERGHFKFDDPITKFLPEFEPMEVLADYDADGNTFTYRPLRPPTMAHLLSHTAGFAYGAGPGTFLDEQLLAENVMGSATTEELIRKVARHPYKSPPGAMWHYSIASDLQGAIIERITGETLDEFLTREVFQPLGMSDTGFFVPEQDQHRVSDVSRQTISGLHIVVSDSTDKATQSQTYFEGGRGLFSTQKDYHQFAEFLRNEGEWNGVRLLRREIVQQIPVNLIQYRGGPGRQRNHGKGAGLGFGLGVGTIENPDIADLPAPAGTFYWYGALGSWFWVDPTNEIVFVGMIQSESVLATDVLRASMQAVYGTEEPDLVEHTAG